MPATQLSAVDILIEDDLDIGNEFLVLPIIERWRAAGRSVSVRRIGEPPTAAIALVHINRTVVPTAALSWAGKYPICLNGAAADLSKRRISSRLVARDDGYDGPVIVKTDANAGGGPDSRKSRRYSGQPRRGAKAVGALVRLLPWRYARALPHGKYPLVARKSAVPTWVWDRHDLVVERLALERSDAGYITRNWIFLGPAERSIICHASGPVVKRDNTVKVELSDLVPEAVREVRARVKCDYGKIDWVLTPEGPFVFDVNTTPTFSAVSDRLSSIVDDLALGLPK